MIKKQIKKLIPRLSKKKRVVAENKEHLQKLIKKEIKKHGNGCSLNHIDTSLINDMSHLFSQSNFNGDISQWDTSNVTDMGYLFFKCKFNGDISQWNTSRVVDMRGVFCESQF